MERELITESLDQKLANSLLVWVVGVQRVRRKKVAMEESGTRKPARIVSLVDDPVLGALVFASRPPHDHISAIDYIDIFSSLDGQPCLLALMPNLEPVLAGLLEQDSDTAKVGVSSDAKLPGKSRRQWRVADHLHHNQGFPSKSLHQGRRVTETLEQDLPDGLAEPLRCLIVIPDGTAKLLFWERGPDIGAIEARMLYYRVLSTYVISLYVSLVAIHLESEDKESHYSTTPENILPLSSRASHHRREATCQTLHILDEKRSPGMKACVSLPWAC